MVASLELVQDIAEQLIIDQINAGNLEDLGDGDRPSPMDLVQAVASRKSGRRDRNVGVFPLITLTNRTKPDRQALLGSDQ